MNRLVDTVCRVGLGWYWFIAFLFTWALLPFAANSILLSLIALCGPAVAASILTFFMPLTERAAIRTRLTHWRLPLRWYFLAVAIPFPVTLLRSLMEHAWNGGPIQMMPISLLGIVVFILVAGEEIGWRGFALPRLIKRFGVWGGSGILGLVWAVWHLPLFFIPSMPQYGSPFLAFAGYTVGLSLVMTYLFQNTAGSVVIATLFHGAVNTFGWVNPDTSLELRVWLNALLYSVVGLLFGILAWRQSAREKRDVERHDL